MSMHIFNIHFHKYKRFDLKFCNFFSKFIMTYLLNSTLFRRSAAEIRRGGGCGGLSPHPPVLRLPKKALSD